MVIIFNNVPSKCQDYQIRNLESYLIDRSMVPAKWKLRYRKNVGLFSDYNFPFLAYNKSSYSYIGNTWEQFIIQSVMLSPYYLKKDTRLSKLRSKDTKTTTNYTIFSHLWLFGIVYSFIRKKICYTAGIWMGVWNRCLVAEVCRIVPYFFATVLLHVFPVCYKVNVRLRVVGHTLPYLVGYIRLILYLNLSKN